MSPEQFAGDATAIDGRSDVYSLGVILFELLARRLPYQLGQLPVHEVARVIQQQEPSRLGSVDTLYRGDVEIIAAKALEKDKARRYATAAHLASDIRRDLRGEAILARPPSALYQLGKFARHHKAVVAGTAGIFATLLMGTAVSIFFAVRAAENARVASEENASPRIRPTRPALGPRCRRSRATTLPMPPASSRRPRRHCAAGNGSTSGPGSTTARPCFVQPRGSLYSSAILARTSGSPRCRQPMCGSSTWKATFSRRTRSLRAVACRAIPRCRPGMGSSSSIARGNLGS